MQKNKTEHNKVKKAICYEERGVSRQSFWWLTLIAAALVIAGNFADILYEPLKLSDTSYFTMKLLSFASTTLIAFLVTERAWQSHSKVKDLIVLAVLAVISEPLYDLGTANKFFDISRHGIMVNVLLCYAYAVIYQHDFSTWFKKHYTNENKVTYKMLALSTKTIPLVLFGFLSWQLKAEYSYYLLLITMLFSFSRKRKHEYIWQFVSVFILMASMYNGTPMYDTVFLPLIPIYIEQCRKQHSQYLVKVDKLSFIDTVLDNYTVHNVLMISYPMCMAAFVILRLIISS